MSHSHDDLATGDIQFYDNARPGLSAGVYEISVTQSLPNSITDDFETASTQRFAVSGPQFVVNPSEIHATFPAANANGDFTLTLPSVVLKSRTLPWERAIAEDASIPWVALLLFQADELDIDPETASPLIAGTVEDFLRPEAGVVKPDIDPLGLSTAVSSSTMNSIRVPVEVFQAVTPRIVELSHLTHVRQVNPEHQVVSAEDDGWFSVVVANRFPASANPADTSGAVNYAHLVSFEGLTQYLVDRPVWPVEAKLVQLVSLASWSFVSAPQPGQTFADLATHLITSAANDPQSLLLRIPVRDDGSAAAARVLDGYTALSFHTGPGPDTFAWYRGPFTPFPAQPLPAAAGEYLTAARAMIYDQTHAVFDNSYGAAWNIGRLTALSDPVFVDALQRLRGGLRLTFRRLLERSKMPHLAGVKDLKELASPGLTQKTFLRMMDEGMGRSLTRSFAGAPRDDGAPHPTTPKNFLFPDDDPPAPPAEEARWFLRKPEVRSFLTGHALEETKALSDWLARLVLLHNVPFNHLVPDQRMLPVESVRFFYVDEGWLQVLFEGAAGVAINGSADLEIHRLIAGGLWEQTRRKASRLRARRRGPAAGLPALPQLPAAGLLLRSALVSGWPGLTVNAAAQGEPVSLMRLDRLAPDVLLALWGDVPDTVAISQPEQGIVFGVEDGWRLPLRSLRTANLGRELGTHLSPVTRFMRPTEAEFGQRVLNLLPEQQVPPPADVYLIPELARRLFRPALSASEFAIEMVMSPERVVFNPPL